MNLKCILESRKMQLYYRA